MKKLLLLLLFSVASYGQAEYEKIAITQNTQDNTAGRLLVQDVTTGEVRWILKSILDNKFNQPTGNATQYLDGAGTPTTFPVLGQSDRVITEVRNSTGATITKGTVVYLNGATGGKPNVQKAQANAEATSSGTFGVIQSDINNNSNGYVVVIGTILGLNTSAYTAGQVLWLSPTTAGGFTTTKPVAPNHAVYVGIVTLAATQGTIEVKIQNGYELDEIHDVLITSKTDNDGLIYESASGLWKNKQITKAMVGLANVDNTSDLNKPISTATQTALNLKENTANKNTANGYAGLGSDGKLISSQLPAITITDTFVVGSQAAMLALTAETGDVAVRTDVNKSFILKGTSAGTLADWQELLTPTSSVTSVFGRQGAVTANNGDYTTALVTETTNKRYQTDIQQTYNDATSSIQTQINSKANDNAVVHLAGSESVTGAKTFTSTPNFDSNIYLKKTGSWANLANYSVIGGMTNGFFLSSATNKHAYLDLFQITQARQFYFPDKSGTFAMTSDVPTISGTTNYVTKFATASTLGSSQIFDDGTKVGIGTDTPAEKLSVSGAIISTGGITGHGANRTTLSQEGANGAYWQSYGANTSTAGSFAFRQASSDFSINRIPLFIKSSGFVGIGTNEPAEQLHVFGNSYTDGSLKGYISGLSAYRTYTKAAQFQISSYQSVGGSPYTKTMDIVSNADSGVGSNMRFLTSTTSGNPTTSMFISEVGNVGIGTINADNGKLTILKNSTYNSYTGAGISLQSNNTNAYTELQLGADDTQNIGYIQSQAKNTSFTTKPLTLNPNGGNVGVGLVNPQQNFVVGAAGGLGNFEVFIDATSVGIQAYNRSTSTYRQLNYDASSHRFNSNVTVYGTVTATGFFQSSDLRLKDIISRDGDVIKYKWKDKRDDKIHIGYVAQEVQKENPEQVNTDDKGMLSVNYIEILVEKIRKLEKEIELLKEK